MRLKRKEAGVYVTEDGRFEVSKGHAYSECDNPHPVQISREVRNEIRTAASYPLHWEAVRRKYGADVCRAVLDGKRGYMCYGGEEHWRVSWGVTDLAKDDYVDGGEDFDTKADAVAFLERMI